MIEAPLFPLFYAAPLSYYSRLAKADSPILLERMENYPKQTYRNRACIHSPNGALDLIIPVQKGKGEHTPYRELRISYENRWQRIHWLSLQAAYRRSPYFEFYEDDLSRFYEEEYPLLFDYNEALMRQLCRLLKLDLELVFTDTYHKTSEIAQDFRAAFPAKQGDRHISQASYYQVFADKNGFIPQLSIFDLLFNLGPGAKKYLLENPF